jgi:hypothetical protein
MFCAVGPVYLKIHINSSFLQTDREKERKREREKERKKYKKVRQIKGKKNVQIIKCTQTV